MVVDSAFWVKAHVRSISCFRCIKQQVGSERPVLYFKRCHTIVPLLLSVCFRNIFACGRKGGGWDSGLIDG